MLSILADSLLVATRLDTANTYAKHPVLPVRDDLIITEAHKARRTFAQIIGLRA